jgi:hypothetical protein
MQQGNEGLGQRSAQLDPFPGARLGEAEPGGVKKIATERGKRKLADPQLRGGAIERVANDRVVKRGKVDTNLVGAPGVELNLDKRSGADAGEHVPVRASFAGIGQGGGTAGGHAEAAFRVARDGQVDAAAVPLQKTVNESDVGLLDGAAAEGFAETGVRGVVFGDEDDPGGVLIEAMDQTRAQGIAANGKSLAAAQQGIDESAANVAGTSMDGHAGRLVDRENVGIFVENIKGDRFRFGTEGRAGLNYDGDVFAAAKAKGAFRGLARDADESGLDELLNASAAEVGDVSGDDAIKTLAGFLGPDDKFVGHWRGYRVHESEELPQRHIYDTCAEVKSFF